MLMAHDIKKYNAGRLVSVESTTLKVVHANKHAKNITSIVAKIFKKNS